MKILYHVLYPSGLGDDAFTYAGYKDAFEDMGHTVVPLTERDDLGEALARLRPDMFIGEGNFLAADLERAIAHLKSFRENGGKVVLHGAMREELAKRTAGDVFVDRYFSEIDPTREFPEFPKERYVRMHWLAASKRYHSPAAPSPKYACDVVYIGANLQKKRDAFSRLLFPLRKKYHVKVFGSDWDMFDRCVLHPAAILERKLFGTGVISGIRLGRQVPLYEERVAYSSAKICLNFHEAHQDTNVKTVNARTFKIPASGGFEVSDYAPQIREFFSEDELVMPKTEEEWFRRIEYYLSHEAERKAIQAKGTARALREHTFHSRARMILDCLSF